MRELRRYVFLCVILLLLVPQLMFAIKIGFLEIVGNYYISLEEIIATLAKCKEGSTVTLADIDSDIFRLRDLGVFQDVKYRTATYIADTVTLTFEVLEYPFVKEFKVNIDGPKLVDTQNLNEVILIENNKVLNYKKLFRTVSAIKTFYMNGGYSTVEVVDNLQKTPAGVILPDQILVLTIREYGLNDIVLKGELGDITYSEVKTLMNLRLFKDFYQDFWRWLRIKSKYYPTVTDYQLALSKLYSTGLLGPQTKYDFEILESPLEKGEYAVNLVLTVQLNPLVPKDRTVEQVKFRGNSLLNEETIKKGLRSLYNSKTVLIDVLRDNQTIKKTYEEWGYPYTIVSASYDEKDKTLYFEITEAVITEIRLEGLQKTKEYLVWSEVRLKPGNFIPMKDLKQTYINLNRTGYFDAVNIEPLGFSAGSTATVLIINLTEAANNITVNAGISYDPRNAGTTFAQKIYGTLKLALINPFGYGQRIDFSATLGKYPILDFGYSIASIFGSPIDAGVTLGYSNQQKFRMITEIGTNVFYDEENYTITPNLAFHIDDFQTISTSFSWGQFARKNFIPTEDATILNSLPQKGTISTLSLTYTFDSRDDTADPQEGINAFARADFSLPFASDPWFRLQENFSIFYSPFDYRHTFAGRLYFGQTLWDPNGVLSYTLGGANNFLIRGVNYLRSLNVEHFGLLNAEYRFRLTQAEGLGVSFAAFLDSAVGFNDFSSITLDNWLVGVGGGVRFTVPGFGILRLDIGWDISPALWGQGGPQWGGFHFGFGQMF